MNEIDKMYEKFGIEKEYECNARFCYGELNACPLWCKNCENLISFFPPFTAEKQIEIVKFLLKKAVYYDVKDDKYWFYYEECESAGYKPFDEAIAHFINKLWKDLTPEEKQQIKEILE